MTDTYYTGHQPCFARCMSSARAHTAASRQAAQRGGPQFPSWVLWHSCRLTALRVVTVPVLPMVGTRCSCPHAVQNLVAPFLTFCRALHLVETPYIASPVPGASPAQTWASSQPSRAHGHHRRLATHCEQLSEACLLPASTTRLPCLDNALSMAALSL